jgi:hypothetical protein
MQFKVGKHIERKHQLKLQADRRGKKTDAGNEDESSNKKGRGKGKGSGKGLGSTATMRGLLDDLDEQAPSKQTLLRRQRGEEAWPGVEEQAHYLDEQARKTLDELDDALLGIEKLPTVKAKPENAKGGKNKNETEKVDKPSKKKGKGKIIVASPKEGEEKAAEKEKAEENSNEKVQKPKAANKRSSGEEKENSNKKVPKPKAAKKRSSGEVEENSNEKVPKPKAAKNSNEKVQAPKAEENSKENSEGTLTFARRYRPIKQYFAAKFDAIKKAYREKLQDKLKGSRNVTEETGGLYQSLYDC